MLSNKLLKLNKETIDELTRNESRVIVGGKEEHGTTYYLSSFLTELVNPVEYDNPAYDGGGEPLGNSGYGMCVDGATDRCTP